MFDILHETDLLLGRIVITDTRKAIIVELEVAVAVVSDGNRTRIQSLVPPDIQHDFVGRCTVIQRSKAVNASRAVSSLMTTTLCRSMTIW